MEVRTYRVPVIGVGATIADARRAKYITATATCPYCPDSHCTSRSVDDGATMLVSYECHPEFYALLDADPSCVRIS